MEWKRTLEFFIEFTVPAVEVLEPELCGEDDVITYRMYFGIRRAEYVWYPQKENMSNYPWEEDDFWGTYELWEKKGYPVERADWIFVEKEG